MTRLITRQEAANFLDVSPQTISNWVKKGILNSHTINDGSNRMLRDRFSIEKYFDTLQDLNRMEKRMYLLGETLKDETEALEKKFYDMSRSRYLFGSGLSENLLRDIFDCVVEVTGDSILVAHEYSILNDLINGRRISDIAEYYSLTNSRILQIIRKAIHKVSTLKKWPEWHQDYKNLVKENQRLMFLLQSQQNRIKDLEIKLNMNDSDDGDETFIFGYTKMELASVLSRNLMEEDLSVRCLNGLKWAGIQTVGQLVRYDRRDLFRLRHLGKKSIAELDDFLESLHLSFGMDIDKIVVSTIK